MKSLTDEATLLVMHTITYEYFKLPKELRLMFIRKVVESVERLKE